MTSISMEDDMDLSMRAPYISMSEADDLPLLISEDLMWGALPCDAPKFMHEPKMNVAVDVQAMQVGSLANPELALASPKAGDFLLSNAQNNHNNNNTVHVSLLTNNGSRDADPSLVLGQSKRRKAVCEGVDVEEQENGKTMPLVSLLLQAVQGHGGQMNTSSSSCSTSSDDTNHSDIIEPMFDEALAKNCEFRVMDWVEKDKNDNRWTLYGNWTIVCHI